MAPRPDLVILGAGPAGVAPPTGRPGPGTGWWCWSGRPAPGGPRPASSWTGSGSTTAATGCTPAIEPRILDDLRSRRLVGLLVDRGFGIAAWQPAWLLAVPAVATLARRRPAGWAALAGPLAAGWLVATLVALTMQGWWFGGRQVMVVLPLAVLAVAWWAGRDPRRLALLAGAGGVGVLALLWLVPEGAAGRVTWAVDPTATANPLYRAWRLVLPDYLAMSWWTWVLHGLWLVGLAAWAGAAAGAGHRLAGFRKLRSRELRRA